MIQHDPTGLQPQIPSAKRQGREADELLRGRQRRPWPRLGSVASAHGHDDVAKPWEMSGKTWEKQLGNGKYLDFVGIHWVLL
jgi:hypothetical protein